MKPPATVVGLPSNGGISLLGSLQTPRRSILVLIVAVAPGPAWRLFLAEALLPGTQPLEGDIEFGKVQQWMLCHGETANGAADPYASWQGGMMAARESVAV